MDEQNSFQSSSPSDSGYTQDQQSSVQDDAQNSRNQMNNNMMDGNYDDYYDDDYDSGGGGGKKVAITAVIVLICGALLGGVLWLQQSKKTEGEAGQQLYVIGKQTIELGDPVVLEPSNFLKTDKMKEDVIDKVTIDSDLISNTKLYKFNGNTKEVVTRGKKYLDLGSYDVTLTYENESDTSEIKVEDTTKPTFVGFSKEISIEQNAKDVKLESYWAAKDLTDVKIKVLGDIDYTKPGKYDVRVTATDTSGNTTSKDAVVKVVESDEVKKGAELTKTKEGNIPLSDDTKNLIASGKLNTNNKNDEQIKKEQAAFDQQIEQAKQDALAQKQKNGFQADGLYYKEGKVQSGPVSYNGSQYYLDKNGKKVTGWININGNDYYYKENGMMAVGPLTINGSHYYFDSTGRKVVGWRTDASGDYYYNNNGVQVFGENSINGKTYYLNPSTGAKYKGFRYDNGHMYYYDVNTGEKAFGETKVGDATYYFNEKTGEMATGEISIVDQDAGNGAKKTVMMDATGKMFYGFMVKDGKTVYFDVNKGGAMAKGKTVIVAKYSPTSQDVTCYFDPETGEMKSGWIEENGVKNYYDPNNNGIMATGLTSIEENGAVAMYDFGANGEQITGLQTIGGFTYYFNPKENGKAASGMVDIPNGSGTKKGYFDSNFHQVKGQQVQSNGKWYYFDKDGNMVTGWQDIEVKSNDGTNKDNQKKIHTYFNKDGSRASGHTQISGKWYYFEPSDGQMANTGLKQVGSDYFFFQPSGERYTGELQIGQDWYYFSPKNNGAAAKGYNGDNGHRYFYSDEGKRVKGWVTIDGKRRYFKNDYEMAVNTTETIDGKRYTFDSWGNLASGFYDDGGALRYVTSGGNPVVGGTVNDGKVAVSADGNGNVWKTETLGFQAWGQQNYGSEGQYMCGPTSVAMAIHYLRGVGDNNFPVEVRNYLTSIGTYAPGTGWGTTHSSGLIRAAQHYGVPNVYGIGRDANQAASALIRGKVIVGSTTGVTPWVRSSSISHIMVLRGYDKNTNMTYVQDPYIPSSSRWYSLPQMMAYSSPLGVLCENGGPWYVLSN